MKADIGTALFIRIRRGAPGTIFSVPPMNSTSPTSCHYQHGFNPDVCRQLTLMNTPKVCVAPERRFKWQEM